MDEGERSTSTGTVIAFGFIILGFLNLFATGFYHRTALSHTGRLPGLLFIAVGITIFIVRAIKKQRNND